MKLCTKCNEIKQLKDFGRDICRKDGYNSRCRTCMVLYRKSNGTPEKTRDYHLRTVYKITTVQYDIMLSLQQGKCYICKRHESELKQRLHVDHDHKSNKIRKLLCSNCNQLLGNSRDNIQILEASARYLKEFAPCKT